MKTGKAFEQMVNSRKMFLTTATVILLSLVYYRLDRAIIFSLMEPENIVGDRIELFGKFAEYTIVLVISYLGINQAGKGKWFNNNAENNKAED